MTGTITRDDAVEVLNGMLDPLRSKLSGRSRLSLRDVRQLENTVAEPVPAAVDALIRVDTKRYLDDLMVWYQSELKERREAEGTPVPTTTLPGG